MKRPVTVEDLAEKLHELEYDFGWEWPLHEDDEGYRGDGGYVRLVPKDIQALCREKAARLWEFLGVARISELEALVYVPGQWRCPKCKFVLYQRNLNAADGSVTSRDKPGEKCPNCDVPLWRMTERENGRELDEIAVQAIEARTAAEKRATEYETDLNATAAKLNRLMNICHRPILKNIDRIDQ